MNIPPVAPIPGFRPGERREDGPATRRPVPAKSSGGKKHRRPSGSLTENLPPDDYDPANGSATNGSAEGPTNGEDGSELGRLTDQSV